jgi:hypothetical protein
MNNSNGNGTERQSSAVASDMEATEQVKSAFISAATRAQYIEALDLARQLGDRDQLHVLDALFDAANRLKLQRTTGEPILEGIAQQSTGCVVVSWTQKTLRVDGSEVRIAQCAMLEPAKDGPGWKATEEIPESIVNAVTSAAMDW